MTKAIQIVDKLLESDELDIDPERYIKATLTPTEAANKRLLQQLGLKPVEPGRSKTMWSKRYPGKEGLYELDVDTEFKEDGRVPFWVTLTRETSMGVEHTLVLVKYFLFSNTFEPVLKQVDAVLNAHAATPTMHVVARIENAMNEVEKRYGRFSG